MSILTGFSQLDDIIGGLRPGELTFIAGRPGMGKTTLCKSIAENITQSGKRVRIEEICNVVQANLKTGDNYDVIFFTALYPPRKKDAADIYSELKTFAVDTGVAYVVEVGVDRIVERMDIRRPGLEHIKYSAVVEKYADNILLVYRDGYYNADADNSIFEVIVAKNNAGRLGTAVLKFVVEEVQTTISVPKITAG